LKYSEEDLKMIFQLSRQAQAGKAGCPPVEYLAKAFADELSEEEKLVLVDHVASCSSCHWKFEMLRGILKETGNLAQGLQGLSLSKEETRRLKEIAGAHLSRLSRKGRVVRHAEPRRQAWKSHWLLLRKYAVAAAGLLIVGLGALFLLRIFPPGGEGPVRGESEESLQLLSPQGAVDPTPIEFSWKPYPGAREYEVRILDEALTPIWTSEKTGETRIQLTPSASGRLEKGKTYIWKVFAMSAGGTEGIGTSGVLVEIAVSLTSLEISRAAGRLRSE